MDIKVGTKHALRPAPINSEPALKMQSRTPPPQLWLANDMDCTSPTRPVAEAQSIELPTHGRCGVRLNIVCAGSVAMTVKGRVRMDGPHLD